MINKIKIWSCILLVGILGQVNAQPMVDSFGASQFKFFKGAEAAKQEAGLFESPLTLDQAIAIALDNNPDLAAIKWDQVKARAVKDKASGERMPYIGMAGDYTYSLDAQRVIPGDKEGVPGSYAKNAVSGNLVLSMPVFTGGRLASLENSANKSLQAAVQSYARSRNELIFNVASLFNTTLAQNRIIESLDFSRKALIEHVKQVEALVSAKKAAPVDRMRTLVRLADIEQQLVRERNLLAIQHRSLANILGVKDVDRTLSVNGELDTPLPPLPDIGTALETARKKRGDYLAAQTALEAQADKVAAARAGHLPQVYLQGAYGGHWALGATTGNGKEQADVGRIGIVFEMPIFDGGQIDAQIREQSATLSATREQVRRLALGLELEVETALLNLSSAEQRRKAILTATEQADESLRIEQLKYSLGKGAIVDVLDAQASLLEIQTTYYRVLAEQHTALAQLKLAMGEE